MANHQQHLVILFLILAIIPLSSACTVCSRCTNCGPDILADKYLDSIDALLQSKVQNLGYPVQIQRIANNSEITYSINYSNGLSVVLALLLGNMQIQLESYSLNTQSQTISTFSSSSSTSGSANGSSSSSAQSKSSSSQNQSITYQQIANYQSSQLVNSILKALSTSSFSFTSSMLANAQQASINGLTYYNFLFILSQIGNIQLPKSIYYQLIITSADNKSFKIANQSYVQLSSPNLVNLTLSDIQNDINIQQIALFVLKQNYSMLSPNSQVVLVARDFPYYRLVFDNQQNTYVTVDLIFDFYSKQVQVTSITSTNFGTSQTNSTSQIQPSQQISPGVQNNATQSSINSNTNSQNTSYQSIGSQLTNNQVTQATAQTYTQVPLTTQMTTSTINQLGNSSQNIPSQSTQTQSESGQTTKFFSGTSQLDQSVINLENITYVKASPSLTTQNYVSLYLKYLATTNFRYTASNLIGIYINSCLPNTLLFRYLYNGQYFNQITTTSDIQQILTQNLGNTVKTQPVIINQAEPKIQTGTTTSQSSNISTSSSTTQNQVDFGGITYIITTSTLSSQSFVSQYLVYLANNYKSYDLNNLVGVYLNPQNNNSLLFRYKYNNQFINLVSNVSDIQQLLQLSQSKNQTIGNTSTRTIITNATQMASTSNQQDANTISTNISVPSSSNSNQSTSANLSQDNIILVPAKSQQTTTQQSSMNNTQQSAVQISSAQLSVVTQIDPKCLCYDIGTCIRCAHRFYLSKNKCIEVAKQCLSYDINSGACRSCVPGYQIQSGVCQKEETTAYYFNNQCIACFASYKMVNQRCVYSPNLKDPTVSVLQAKNVLCASWSAQNCLQCMPGTFLSSRGICELIDPFCLLFDYVLQSCNSCEKGYSLRNGRCFRQ